MKSKILAATALVSMMAVPTAALAQQTAAISVARQVLLDGGLAGSTLLKDETVSINASGTAAGQCVLSWGATGAAPADLHALTDVAAFGDSSVSVVNATATITADRVNPQNQAIGKAVYTGSYTTPAAASLTNSLTCPTPAEIVVEIQEERGPGTAPTPDRYETVDECKDRLLLSGYQKPDDRGWGWGNVCDYTKQGHLAQQVPGTGSEGGPGPIITPYSRTVYTPIYTLSNVTYTFSSGTATLDGVSFPITF